MKYWIVPCKESTFLIDVALKANQDRNSNTFVDWRQSNDFTIGDIVFLYKTSPKSQIAYRMEVEQVGLYFDESTDKEMFWKDKPLFYDGLGSHRYVRFRLLMEYPDGFLTIRALHEHGLRGNIQGVMQCKNEELLSYLKGEYLDFTPIDNSNLENSSVAEFTEGEVHEVVQNRYERNREARDKCIEAKGCKCAVCGMDFEEWYGEIGRGFIHVHHLIPISSIGENYVIDPIKDLVPVCPNCHNMLHRKDPPFSPEELKAKMNKIKNKEYPYEETS